MANLRGLGLALQGAGRGIQGNQQLQLQEAQRKLAEVAQRKQNALGQVGNFGHDPELQQYLLEQGDLGGAPQPKPKPVSGAGKAAGDAVKFGEQYAKNRFPYVRGEAFERASSEGQALYQMSDQQKSEWRELKGELSADWSVNSKMLKASRDKAKTYTVTEIVNGKRVKKMVDGKTYALNQFDSIAQKQIDSLIQKELEPEMRYILTLRREALEKGLELSDIIDREVKKLKAKADAASQIPINALQGIFNQ